jgi:hypothetical protein
MLLQHAETDRISIAEEKNQMSTVQQWPTVLRAGLRARFIKNWGTASTSNIEIPERFQSKALRMIVDASCYVPNTVIRRDLYTPTVKEEIRRYSSQYSARLSAHPNGLIVNLIELP